jgi:hypothetical protein
MLLSVLLTFRVPLFGGRLPCAGADFLPHRGARNISGKHALELREHVSSFECLCDIVASSESLDVDFAVLL